MFTQKDLRQIADKGISVDDINLQIKYFQNGFPPSDITMPANPGRGILVLSEGDEQHYLEVFLNKGPGFHMTRFIPASGAATRMFKSLFETFDKLQGKSSDQQARWIDKEKEIGQFFNELEKYPFYKDLDLSNAPLPADVLRKILTADGLDYGNKPKGLLQFHTYSETDRRTSFEEHVREALMYCVGSNGEVRIHMTVSPAHLDGFQTEAACILPKIEKETGLHVELTFSFQKPETDTLAVSLSNEPFRNQDGTLLFRPGGHGSLIRNLDELQSDILFISNIDNVAPDRTKTVRVRYKQILGGILLEVRSKIFESLQLLNSGGNLEKTRMDSMLTFLHEKMGMAIPEKLKSLDTPELKQWLINTMNRPIRVCGMVRNEGEPGGGPFYVRSESGELSLQIVESSQIDLEDEEKAKLVKQSTHFNPVDLVCSTRDYQGKKFQLTRFVDPNTGFISEKSVGGMSLKALELPGLWNGAMAHWLTLFVEVPVVTFSPVKTVFDLMRAEHRE
ncbi:MAG: DUF4301 family protein [Bacteroidota bacterium]